MSTPGCRQYFSFHRSNFPLSTNDGVLQIAAMSDRKNRYLQTDFSSIYSLCLRVIPFQRCQNKHLGFKLCDLLMRFCVKWM